MVKKIALVLAACFAVVFVAGCSNSDSAKLTELENRIKALETENGKLKKDLEDRTTVFYDWDNPIITTSDEIADIVREGFDKYLECYGNKVIQINGKITGILGSPNYGLSVRSSDGGSSVSCMFPNGTDFGLFSINQQLTVKGVGGGGVVNSTAGFFTGMYFCRVV